MYYVCASRIEAAAGSGRMCVNVNPGPEIGEYGILY